ncbi:hypothetical protein WT49_07460 [Burkholderia territorii]|nr:hypothetical protein WT50_31105 [Burkholderia territorii]KWE39752.1 hypothetical protein WT49_07460 [Burkholderia territorii]KWE42913.1 hypothetical protein WT51_01935 [Burkholderia territorii]
MRLSHVLEIAQALQAQRDNSRIGKAPSRTHRGDSTKTNRNTTQPNKKKQREFTQTDVEKVIVDLAERRQVEQPARKPGRRSARGSDANESIAATLIGTSFFIGLCVPREMMREVMARIRPKTDLAADAARFHHSTA